MAASPALRPRRIVRVFLVIGALALPVLLGGPGDYVCAPVPVEPAVCPAYVSSTVDCPYGLVEGDCATARCQPRCAADGDCRAHAEAGYGPHCVAGNCVHCWSDEQCSGGLCRGGRCVAGDPDPPICPGSRSCPADRCFSVAISEEPCRVCVCDSIFDRPCATDYGCQILSSHPYRACVYGRCVECRNDDDCGAGLTCMPPGLCFLAEPHPTALYGLWLVGWPGGMDHFSYVRFEPDGTFRRGRYDAEGAWADDQFLLTCGATEWPPAAPQLGTWEVEQTQSMQLAIRIRPNGDCWITDDAPYRYRYMVTLSDDGRWLTLTDIDHGDASPDLIGGRVPMDRCTPSMASCQPPQWEDIYEYPWNP